MIRPTFIDMFAGAGLYSAGMMQAGFEPVLAIELAADAVASYRRNVAPCAVQASVTEFSDIPKARVLIAGPPCQGFSTLGRRDPADVRNNLSLSVLPWLDASGADVAVIENVPPFLRSAQWAELRDGLVGRGFEVVAWELDAADFGAPQFRRRAFTVASRIGPISEPVPSGRHISAGEVLSRPIVAGDPMHRWPTPSALAASRMRNIPPTGDKRDLMKDHPEMCPSSWFAVGCHATDVWGRMRTEGPSNTLRCTFQNPSKGRYIHPTEDRVLSLREGARLQGIPDNWIFEGRPYPVARQIGNGVPIPLAAAVGRSVFEALAGKERFAIAA